MRSMKNDAIIKADAYHVACAILSESDYFLSTDDRLLKYKTDRIKMSDPTDFKRSDSRQNRAEGIFRSD